MGLAARNEALKRCLYLIQLRSGKYTEIAKLKGVHPRTIERDCYALKDAGFDIKLTGSRMNGHFEIIEDPGWFLAAILAVMNAIGLKKAS